MKTYAIVGTGNRGTLAYAVPLVRDYAHCARLLGVYDANEKRARAVSFFTGSEVPVFASFKELLAAGPDVVIVTTKDSTHGDYIVRALEAGCDVISEKPMTTDETQCARILEAEARTGRRVTVTFNARYLPFRARVKELLREGVIGEVLSVHFEWMLDTSHGADYFRRWHRRRENSGSLLIHKATHHFDLVNWFLEQDPVKVNAFGTRRFYGPTRENRGERCLTCPHQKTCEFYFDLTASETHRKMYLECEDVDGYWRDGCVFSDEIDIEDSVCATVSYSGGTVMSYSLTAHSPYECYKMVLNGTNGRMELDDQFGENHLRIYNRHGEEVSFRSVEKKALKGDHGGSDKLLRDMLFDGPVPDPLGQAADTRAGAMSIAIGIAANKSMKEDRAVYIKEFLSL